MARRAVSACARLLAAPLPAVSLRGFAAGASTSAAAPELSSAVQPQAEAPRRSTKAAELKPWEMPRNPKPVVLPPEALPPLKPRTWGAESKRTGVLGIKCGMTAEWTAWGERLPITVLWLDDCQARPARAPWLPGIGGATLGPAFVAPRRSA